MKNGKPSPRFGKKSMARRKKSLRNGNGVSKGRKAGSHQSRTRQSKSKQYRLRQEEEAKLELQRARKKTPVRNSDRAVVKRPNRRFSKGRNSNTRERKHAPKASKSPLRPPLAQKVNNQQQMNLKTPKKAKRWEMLYNMANSKSKS